MVHTNGIWMVAKNGIEDKHQYTILSNATKAICDVYRQNWPKKKRAQDIVAKANADLLAAAPDLYNALDKLIDVLNEQMTQDCFLNKDIQVALKQSKKALKDALVGKKF